jgi:hypothetical protein
MSLSFLNNRKTTNYKKGESDAVNQRTDNTMASKNIHYTGTLSSLIVERIYTYPGKKDAI